MIECESGFDPNTNTEPYHQPTTKNITAPIGKIIKIGNSIFRSNF
jgi:hypothetical protein